MPSIPLTYLKVLQEIAHHAQVQLDLIPHKAEKGRALEGVIANMLRRLLPQRYSIGTGFIINAAGDVSKQQDIIIYDHIFNAPLLTEFSAGVFPIECVYATMEVKTTLTKTNFGESLTSIRRIRAMGTDRRYFLPATPESNFRPQPIKFDIPPRSYIVASRQRGWGKDIDGAAKVAADLCKVKNDHFHGLCVLTSDWFMFRKAYKKPPQIIKTDGNALASLYRAIIDHSLTYPIYPADMSAYWA